MLQKSAPAGRRLLAVTENPTLQLGDLALFRAHHAGPLHLIDPAGKLVYAGGIDDKRSSNPADIPAAKNFVRAALADSLAGKPVAAPTAPPYGCSIKFDAS